MDIDTLKNHVQSIEARLGQLRASERIFIQRDTYDREALKAKEELEGHRTAIAQAKASMETLTTQRDAMINQSMTRLLERLKNYLPTGEPIIEVGEGRVEIVWVIGDKRRTYRALSGGERVSFDLAMSAAMGAGLIIKEASELDPGRLAEAMERLEPAAPQVLLVTCHDVAERYEGWQRCETPVSKSA